MSTIYGAQPYKVLPQGAEHPEHTLTARMAARYLGFSDAWLSALRTEGRGPRFIKVGSRYWYSRPDLDQWREVSQAKLPVCKILGLSPAPGNSLPWYKPAEPTYGEFTRYRVVLPPELTSAANGGFAELVVQTSERKP